VQRSSGLRLQLFGVKTFLLFFYCLSNGNPLATEMAMNRKMHAMTVTPLGRFMTLAAYFHV